MSKFGLGKGLGALIPTDSEPEDAYIERPVEQPVELPRLEEVVELPTGEQITVNKNEIGNIPVEDILPNPYQPRKVFDPLALHELSESILKHGIIQPLVVTKRADGKYELLAGERRLQASKLAGLAEVPAIVRAKDLGNQEKLELAIIENLQREDLNIIEQARAFQRLHDEFGLTYDEVAEKVSKSRPAVSNIVRLLQLPVEIQRSLMDGKISEGHGRALLQVADREGQFSLYEMIIKKKLATDQAMILSKEWTARPQLLKTNTIKGRETMALQNSMRVKLGVKSLSISKSDNGGGKIVITCLTDDEFNALIEKFDSLN